MKIHKRMIITGLAIVVAFFCCLPLLNVSAQNNLISGQQIEQIRSNCVSTKNTLNQLHASDALLRVNRGQVYESILTKLLDKFNSRLANNKMSSNELTSITGEYVTALNNFRQDYKSYEEHLSATIDIDCSAQPEAFYNSVLVARTERTKVHSDVQKLNQLLDKYQASLTKIENDYKAAIEEIKN